MITPVSHNMLADKVQREIPPDPRMQDSEYQRTELKSSQLRIKTVMTRKTSAIDQEKRG